MAESQKAGGSSVKLKEKASDLDLDFGKDFMSSWKDDGMDFDFGSPAKGKKKTFDFGKLDMDFNLDGDFDKVSSFKIDMPDLDISTPQRKAGKEKEHSKEVSPRESNRKRKDTFAFSFDFNEFADLNFEKKHENGSAKPDKSKSKEVFSSQSVSGGSGAPLAKDSAQLEDDISSKLLEERVVEPFEMDTEVGNVETPDTGDRDGNSKSITENSFTQIPANSEEKYTIETDATNKTNAVIILEKEQEEHQLEKVSPAEAYHPELVQNSSGQSLADNASTQNTLSDLEEEVFIPANVNSRESGEQNISGKLIGPDSINESSRDESLPSDNVTNSPTENVDMSKLSAVSDVSIATYDIEMTHSEFDHPSIPNVSKKLLQGAMTNDINHNFSSKLLVVPVKSGTAKNNLVPEIEEGPSVIHSKYFKRPNETESQSQQASLSKLISSDSKRIGTPQVNVINERVTDLKAKQSGICLTGISRSQPRKLGGEPVQTGHLECLKGVNRNLDCPNANTIEPGSKLTDTSRTNDQDLSKEGLRLARSGNNIEDPSARSAFAGSSLHPSSSNRQENKSTSKTSTNFRVPVSSITSTKYTTNPFSEKKAISPDQAGRRTPELPVLKSLRTMGGKLEPMNSVLLKGIKSTRNSEQSIELQENVGSKKTHSTEIKKQTPPIPTLKRKAFEDSNTDKLAFTPSKRLSASPSESRNAREPSVKAVNEKAYNHEKVVVDNARNTTKDCATPTVDIPLESNYTELETTLSLETDSNIEKAEALSKELEQICNMLKKKHEEAKEILVRAIVNNNNLLMLNHPMHLEKIHMVQKFAALLISK